MLRAGLLVKSRALADDMIAVMQRRAVRRQQGGQPLFALDQWPRAQILAVEMQQIEQKEHQPGSVAGVGSGLNAAERGDAVGADAAQFAVEIGLAGIERRDGPGDRRIFLRPVEPGTGQQFDRATVEPRMHAIAVIFDFVQPLIAVGRGLDQLRELRRDPFRHRGRISAPPARYGARHLGIHRR